MIKAEFQDLERVKQVYDPIVVEKAAYSTVNKTQGKAATRMSRAVRREYAIKAREINRALHKRIRRRGGIPEGLLIYTGTRLSLRHFSSYKGGVPKPPARPKRRSPKGTRYGARVRVLKTRKSHIVPRGFWGRGRRGRTDGAGEWQIFQRVGVSRLPIRKLSGPSIAHMIRNESAQNDINRLLQEELNDRFSHELDHFLQRQIGLR